MDRDNDGWACEGQGGRGRSRKDESAESERYGSGSTLGFLAHPTACSDMRVFSVESDGRFTEYERLPFEVDHEESLLEEWLESNPDGILEDGRILIIGRQIRTDFGGFVDLLGVDREGSLVVVELKRDRTPRDVVAQALEYAAFAARLDVDALEGILRVYQHEESLSLAEHHREYFGLDESVAIAFNKDQRIVIIGQRVTPEIRQTASFLGSKGIHVTCVEFTFFQASGGGRLLSQEIVVGKPRRVTPDPLPVVSEGEFLNSCDEYGKAVFSRILDLAQRKSMSVRWGTRGFSVGVDVDGGRVVVCYAYPPGSMFKQSVYTALRDSAGIQKKTGAPPEAVDRLQESAEATKLFAPAGRDLKCLIDREFTVNEMDGLVAWFESVEQAIRAPV